MNQKVDDLLSRVENALTELDDGLLEVGLYIIDLKTRVQELERAASERDVVETLIETVADEPVLITEAPVSEPDEDEVTEVTAGWDVPVTEEEVVPVVKERRKPGRKAGVHYPNYPTSQRKTLNGKSKVTEVAAPAIAAPVKDEPWDANTFIIGEIRRNVPVPDVAYNRVQKYPIGNLEVGESFELIANNADNLLHRAARKWRDAGRQFRIRGDHTPEGGTRRATIWRLS